MSTPTPHMTAHAEAVSSSLLLTADPQLAKEIAEESLTEVKKFNEVRNIDGYSGLYEDVFVSVMGCGVGMPSTGIYAYELFNFYGVEKMIHISEAERLSDGLSDDQIVLAIGTSVNSNYILSYELPGRFAPIASFDVLRNAVSYCQDHNISYQVGNVLTEDVYYHDQPDDLLKWKSMGVLAWDMEAAAVYLNAARAGKKALSIQYFNEKSKQSAIKLALALLK